MSDSFDPEGDTITNYHFDFINYPAPFDTPAPAPTIDLPPGCHTILATITTSDGRTGSTLGILKNYPIWEDTPHLLATPAVAFTHRLRDMRGVLDPATSRPLFVGWDLCAMGFVSWWQNSAGDFIPHSVPFYRSGPPPYIGEPLAYDNQVYLPVGGPEFFWIARLEPMDGELMNLGIPFPGDPCIALAHDHETETVGSRIVGFGRSAYCHSVSSGGQ